MSFLPSVGYTFLQVIITSTSLIQVFQLQCIAAMPTYHGKWYRLLTHTVVVWSLTQLAGILVMGCPRTCARMTCVLVWEQVSPACRPDPQCSVHGMYCSTLSHTEGYISVYYPWPPPPSMPDTCVVEPSTPITHPCEPSHPTSFTSCTPGMAINIPPHLLRPISSLIPTHILYAYIWFECESLGEGFRADSKRWLRKSSTSTWHALHLKPIRLFLSWVPINLHKTFLHVKVS